MERIPVTVSKDKEIHHFEVSEHPHHNGGGCKYRVFEHGNFVASFEPDAENYLHICQNASGIDEELLYQLADQIEALIPIVESKHLNDNAS